MKVLASTETRLVIRDDFCGAALFALSAAVVFLGGALYTNTRHGSDGAMVLLTGALIALILAWRSFRGTVTVTIDTGQDRITARDTSRLRRGHWSAPLSQLSHVALDGSGPGPEDHRNLVQLHMLGTSGLDGYTFLHTSTGAQAQRLCTALQDGLNRLRPSADIPQGS